MEASNYLKAVRDQYEAFPYPPRNPSDEKVRLENSWHDFLELINFYCFKGRNNFSQECRVLVAGGGTGDQTIFLAEQLRYNRRAEVVHLDISEKCNEIAKRRAEVRKLVNHRISLFSGIDFNVAPSQGLNGTCDFILAASPVQLFLRAPVMTVVEAKNDLIRTGLGQCIAAMVGAQFCNQQAKRNGPRVYGVVSTGSAWTF